MNADDSHPQPKTAQQPRRNWIMRLLYSFLPEPKDQKELMDILRDAKKQDILNAEAFSMIEGVLQVCERQVRDIMINRSQMVVVNHDDRPDKVLPILIDSHHSRFPVLGESRDEVIGILLAKDLLRYTFSKKLNFNINDMLRPAVYVPESKRLDILLREFRLNRNHMAIVIDEYGRVSGLVTIEDVLEQIVGDIEDEYDIDASAHYIKKLKSDQYLVKALTPIKEFNEQFDANFSDENFDTIGGLIIQKLGCLPKRGEVVQLEQFQFKVMNADSRRIRLFQVNVLDKESPHARTQ